MNIEIENVCVRKAIKFIALCNFFVFVLFVVPPAHRLVDRGFSGLRSVGLEHPFGVLLQVWLVGSTLALTGLLAWMFWERRNARFPRTPPMKTEGILVATWWLLVLGACAYGFMLGMGG